METKRKNGTSLLQWRTRSKYVWRYDGIVAKAKLNQTLTPLSRHWGIEVTEAEAEALVRLKAERVLIAEAETRIAETLERKKEVQAKAREIRLAMLDREASRPNLTQEELAELAELMAA